MSMLARSVRSAQAEESLEDGSRDAAVTDDRGDSGSGTGRWTEGDCGMWSRLSACGGVVSRPSAGGVRSGVG